MRVFGLMTRKPASRGTSDSMYIVLLGSVVVVVVLGILLLRGPRSSPDSIQRNTNTTFSGKGDSGELFMYCAAGMRYPVEEIAKQYKETYGVTVELQYGGSNTLLNQLQVSKTGDLYLAADNSYIELARQKELTQESIPLAVMKPVIAVRVGNPKGIKSINDLLRDDVKVALGDPNAAAIGKKTRQLLSASGQWAELEKNTVKGGVFKPTVNDVAGAVKLGSVDAGIIWDATVVQYGDLAAVEVSELDPGKAKIEVAIVKNSKVPSAALRFARYLAARDRGLEVFRAKGFEPIDGDVWDEQPELTFFAGAVNRAALEPIINEFQQREGVKVNAVFNGCGILTATMRGIVDGQAGSFPDVYMACDVYYLEAVDELFQDSVNVSETDIVILTEKENPKQIASLADLAKPGVRIVLGQPDKCTIGELSKRLLQSEGIYEEINSNGNLVNQTISSALLVAQVATGAADAVLAYRTDARAESNRLTVIDIDSQLAKAVQPFSVARSSDHKYLGRRLFDKLAQSRDRFESKGFSWRLDKRASGGNQQTQPPPVNDSADNAPSKPA